MLPSISLVVCAHNEEKYIERCLRSISAQKYDGKFEVVVVDDASGDRTGEILKKTRLKFPMELIENNTQMGIGYSSNRGIEASNGRRVVRVDADDFISVHFLQVLDLALTENIGSSAVRCDYNLVDSSGKFIKQIDASEHPIACGILRDRDALVEAGLYDPSLRLHEDLDLERRFSQKFPTLHIPIPLYRYRMHDGNSVGYRGE